MVQCGICFADYQEGEMELHRELCVVLLVFRCTICNVDYLSKEGLWNHLDLHQIADESKELHYEEMKAKQKKHQCVLCNDHRAYSESLYWNHVHDVHDGFFLRCSDCGENFQSERHKNEHAFSHCKIKDDTVALKLDVEVDKVSINIENNTPDRDEDVSTRKKQNSSLNSSANSKMDQPPAEIPNEGRRRSSRIRSGKLNAVNDTDNSSSIESLDTKCLHCNKDYVTARLLREHIRTCHKPIECTVCGITNYGMDQARYHKISKHMEPSFECAKCLKKFHFKKHYTRHSYSCDPEGSLLSLKMSQPPDENFVNEGKRERGLLGRKTPSVQPIDGSERISLTKGNDPELHTEKLSSEDASFTPECSLCGIKESNAVTLVRHILTHHEPVACDICGITSPSLFQAQDHKTMVHRESKNKCPHCSIQTWSGMQFQIHVVKCKNLRFLCELCGKMFADMSTVNEHKKKCRKTVRNVHTDVSKMSQKSLLPQSSLSESKCYYCNEDFSSPGYLNHHLKTYHELTKCDICGISILGISSRKYHKVLCHKEPKFACTNCGKTFYHQGAHNKHWSYCERKKYVCDICGHRSKHANIIKRHKRIEHPERVSDEETTILSQEVDGADALEENENDYDEACSSRQSSTQGTNSNHYQEFESLEDSLPFEHSLPSVDDDNDTDSHMAEKKSRMRSVATFNDSCEVQEESLQPLVQNESVQQFRCCFCNKTFSEFSLIRQHMLTSHTDGKLQCHLCSKKIRTKKELADHTIVCAERKFSCEFCSHKFKFKWGLKKHNSQFHPGCEPSRNATAGETKQEQSYNVVDTDSEKLSEVKSALQRQVETTSSGSSNAKCCPYCEKNFSNKDLLTRHIDKCHEPIACEICGLTFSSLRRARFHKLTCTQRDGSKAHGVKETQSNSLCMPRAEQIELNMEIKVEDTMLQEKEQQVPNEDQGISCTSTAIIADKLEIGKHPCGSESKGFDDRTLSNGIKIKEECIEEEEEDNKPLARYEAGDQMDQFYMTKIHTELHFKNPACKIPSDNIHALQNPKAEYSKDILKKSHLTKHALDQSEPSESKKRRMNKDKLNSL